MPRPGALIGKRFLGYASYLVKRTAVHSPARLAALLDDLGRQPVDHVVVTGDLTTLALPEEFAATAAWLATLGGPERVTVIPGNHDAYVRVGWEMGLHHWSPWMSGDTAATVGPEGFPFLRIRDGVALIGLSTAIPTGLGSAAGALGGGQLGRLEKLLDSLDDTGLCRVVLVHHPPDGTSTSARRRLRDEAALRAVLARHGADLVLYGHNHRAERFELATPAGPIPMIAVPSASALAGPHRDAAAYNLCRLQRDGDGWRIAVEQRRIEPDGVTVTSLEAGAPAAAAAPC